MDALLSAGAQPVGAQLDAALLGRLLQDIALAGFAEIGSENPLSPFGEQHPLARLLHPGRPEEDSFDQLFQAMLLQAAPSQQTIRPLELTDAPVAVSLEAALPTFDVAEPSQQPSTSKQDNDATSVSALSLIFNLPMPVTSSETPPADVQNDSSSNDTISALPSGFDQRPLENAGTLVAATKLPTLPNPAKQTTDIETFSITSATDSSRVDQTLPAADDGPADVVASKPVEHDSMSPKPEAKPTAPRSNPTVNDAPNDVVASKPAEHNSMSPNPEVKPTAPISNPTVIDAPVDVVGSETAEDDSMSPKPGVKSTAPISNPVVNDAPNGVVASEPAEHNPTAAKPEVKATVPTSNRDAVPTNQPATAFPHDQTRTASQAATTEQKQPQSVLAAAPAVAPVIEENKLSIDRYEIPAQTPVKKSTESENPASVSPSAQVVPLARPAAGLNGGQLQQGTEHQWDTPNSEPTAVEVAAQLFDNATARQHVTDGLRAELGTPILSTGSTDATPVQQRSGAGNEGPTIRTIAERLSEAIYTHTPHEGRSSFEVKLDPPELGTVWLRLTSTRHGLDAQLVVANDSTRQLIENNVASLKDSMRDAGVSLQQFDVSQHGGSQPEWNEPQPMMVIRPAAFRPSTANGGATVTLGQSASSSNAIDLMA